MRASPIASRAIATAPAEREPARAPRLPIGRLAAAFVLVAAFCLVASTGSAWARDRSERTDQIRVSGRAEATAAPDRVSVDISVVTRSESAQDAAERNANETSAVVGKLRESFGETAELSTSGYTLTPEFQYDKREGRRKSAGFSARNTVHVELSDVDAAGRLIDAAVAAGANEVRSVRFSVADASALERQALVDAATDARAKAEALAASMGMKLGRTLRIEEHGAGPMPVPHAFMARAQAESTPVEPSDVYVEASVALWLELVEK